MLNIFISLPSLLLPDVRIGHFLESILISEPDEGAKHAYINNVDPADGTGVASSSP